MHMFLEALTLETLTEVIYGFINHPNPVLGWLMLVWMALAASVAFLGTLLVCFKAVVLVVSLILALLGKPEPLFFFVKAWALRR